MTPTTAGEGKTTTSGWISRCLNKQGEKVLLHLREPSLGPVFGNEKAELLVALLLKLLPMEDNYLHFNWRFPTANWAA